VRGELAVDFAKKRDPVGEAKLDAGGGEFFARRRAVQPRLDSERFG
jgi:hypothetical protein